MIEFGLRLAEASGYYITTRMSWARKIRVWGILMELDKQELNNFKTIAHSSECDSDHAML